MVNFFFDHPISTTDCDGSKYTCITDIHDDFYRSEVILLLGKERKIGENYAKRRNKEKETKAMEDGWKSKTKWKGKRSLGRNEGRWSR